MSRSRSITDFFGRSSIAETNTKSSKQKTSNRSNPLVASSPPSRRKVSSSLAERNRSSYPNAPTGNLEIQVKIPLLNPTEGISRQNIHDKDSRKAKSAGCSSVGGSFTSSRRLFRDGREIITSTDSEDTDSITSLEDVDDLLRQFTRPKDDLVGEPSNGDSVNARLNLQQRRGAARNNLNFSEINAPNYRNTLEMLVTETVDDNETEAGVARLKAAMQLENSEAYTEVMSDGCQRRGLHEDMITAALGDKGSELGLHRLLDAVRRTEAFEKEKSWSFFDHETDIPPAFEFPRNAIAPGKYLAGLRDPESRERIFQSGIIEFALTRDLLPSELVTWIFHSVSSEPHYDLRKAYCKAIKHVPAARLRSLIRPDDIDNAFRHLGAGPKALSTSTPITPEDKVLGDTRVDRSILLSVFELLRYSVGQLAHDTRTHVLIILSRLAVDRSLTSDAVISYELERTITAALEGIPKESVETTVRDICGSLFETVKDPLFQSYLLAHILPTADWIALFRCRLATAFITQSRVPLSEPSDAVLNLRRIADVLRGQRFNTKHQPSDNSGYDYGDLNALTSLLNVAIESWVPRGGFSKKAEERSYNADVDLLAERVKMIFTSIQGLGASHLKRALAKSALETLYYRILYSVRSKPSPKVILFDGKNDIMSNWTTIDQWASGSANDDVRENHSV